MHSRDGGRTRHAQRPSQGRAVRNRRPTVFQVDGVGRSEAI